MRGAKHVFPGNLVLISTFFLKFIAIGTFNSSGLYLGVLSRTFSDCNRGFLAFYCTVQIVIGLASSFVGGVAQEALERKGIGLQWLFFFGGIFMALGLFVSSMSTTIAILISGASLTGIGLGLCGFLAGGICVLWFESARGTMLLLAMSGEGIGNIFFSWLTARLLEMFGSYTDDAWRPVMRCVGALSFVLCSIASISMRLPIPGEVEEHEKKEGTNNRDEISTLAWDNDVNYDAVLSNNATSKSESDVEHPHNIHINLKHTRASIIDKERKRSSIHMLATYEALGDAHLIPTPSPRQTEKSFRAGHEFRYVSSEDKINDDIDESLSLGEISRTATNIWLCAFSFISCFSILNLQVLLASYTSSLGMAPSVGGHVLAMCGVGILFSNLTLGPVVDGIGSRRLLTLSFFCISILFFVWPRCISAASLSALAFCYGYLCCTMSSLPVIILADAYGECCPGRVLALNGVTNLFKFPGYLLGPSVAGMMVEKGGYNLAGSVSGLITLTSTLTLLMIPSPEKQEGELLEMKRKKSKSNSITEIM
ncbi:hypothetical protein ACHAXM_000960 [Skeletonema potamos]|jgi:MFS family permease